MELRRSYARFLREQRVARLGTITEDGSVHLVPICYAYDGKAIYVGTGADSKKVKNLKANPKATLLVDVYYENWSRLKHLMLVCGAELLEGGDEFRYARKLLYRKYRQYERDAPLEEGESVIIKLTPKRAVAYNL